MSHLHAAILLAAAALWSTSASAEDASDWVAETGASVRLIAAGAADDGTVTAGIEIALDPDFKTYWRTPGDSGVAPQFDWSTSVNIDAVEVMWPAPLQFSDGAGTSYGYKDHVVLPLRVVPRDKGTPMRLELSLDIGVCKDICVPAHVKLALADPAASSGTGPHARRLAEAEARVPVPTTLGAPGEISVASAHWVKGAMPAAVELAVTADEASPVEMFPEGPPDWYLPPVAAAGRDGASRRLFRLVLDGLPKKATTAGATVRLTVTAGDAAVELPLALDAVAATP